MPELPEVETICRGIRPHIIGRSFLEVRHSGKNLRNPVPIEKIQSLIVGKSVENVRRRAKYLLIDMNTGALLVFHLGMTGNLGIFSPKAALAKHCHLQFLMNDDRELRYNDVRRFGSINVFSAEETQTIEDTFFSNTGPEPFSDSFNAEYLYALARKRHIPVKNFIMQNQIVAGVGNIYANESLFAAGIHPKRHVNTISKASWQRLIDCIQKVLNHAIDCGGSTISDYVNANQQQGYFQINFKIYNRENLQCLACNGRIGKMVIGGRASYFCSQCQK